jgi:hypothetical protein
LLDSGANFHIIEGAFAAMRDMDRSKLISWSRRRTLLACLSLAATCRTNAQAAHKDGFPPLAVVTIAVSNQEETYSHLSNDMWEPIWNRLIEMLLASLGDDRVTQG